MPPELHLRPDALDHHARRASGLADELHEALRGAPDDGEAERLRGVVEAAAAELTELSLAEGVTLPLRADVQIRYRARPVPAEVRALGAGALVQFETKVVSVVPGQYAVFYDGDRVLGGGRITRSLPMAPTELPA